MTGLEKIIKEIQDEAAAEAAQVVAKARTKADEILAQSKAESDAKIEKIASSAAQDAADIKNAQQSALVLQRRQRTLQTKQDLLADTLQKALETLQVLEDKEYFALLVRLAAKTAQPGEGELLMNERDTARKPANFEKQVNEALPKGTSLKLSAHTRPIDGGFVLNYGGVEENCSFKALFSARRDEFYDLVRDTLFA